MQVLVNDRDGALILALPKTGSQTLKALMHGEVGGKFFHWKDPKGGLPGWTAVGMQPDEIARRISSGYQYIVTIRNPYSRAVSMWWSTCMTVARDHYDFVRRAGGEDFATVMEWAAGLDREKHTYQDLLYPQTELLDAVGWQPTTWLHTETLAEGLARLPWFADRMIDGIPTFNASEGRDRWETYYDERALEAVHAWCEEDVDRWSYSKLEWRDGRLVSMGTGQPYVAES